VEDGDKRPRPELGPKKTLGSTERLLVGGEAWRSLGVAKSYEGAGRESQISSLVDVAKKERCASEEDGEWMKKGSGRWRDRHVTLGVLGVRSWRARQKVSVRSLTVTTGPLQDHFTTGPLYDRTAFDFFQIVLIDESLTKLIGKHKFHLKTGLFLGDFSHVSCQAGITRCRTWRRGVEDILLRCYYLWSTSLLMEFS
jgi:hypothetical protein